ncbi:MAG: hypothetical protein ACTSWN_11345 [Promethearchaeota archaeon]
MKEDRLLVRNKLEDQNRSNSAERLASLVPSFYRYVKGDCFLIPKPRDCFFLLDHKHVFYLKKRCLSCFHLQRNGCGIGSDCKSICLVPFNGLSGWSNIVLDGRKLERESLVLLSKMFILEQEDLPEFIKEQIPSDFHDSKCNKFIQIQPIYTRMLMDLEKQEKAIISKIHNGELPLEQKERFINEIRHEKDEIKKRLLLVL